MILGMRGIAKTLVSAGVWLVAVGCGGANTSAETANTFAATSGGDNSRSTAPTPTGAVATSDATSATMVGPETTRADQLQASMGYDQEHPVGRCGPRDSYRYIASEFRCPDGSNPLNGDLRAGHDARLGNVGENSSGHIIDLYQIPCAGGAQRVYVDMYICPPGVNPLTGL